MSTNLPVTLTPVQQKIYDEQPNAWKVKANKALANLRGMLRANVITRYELGELVREMAGDESKYGDSAVPSLALVIGESAETLWQCRTLAMTYTQKQLEVLLDRSNRRGHPLAWSHLRLLSSMDNPKARKQLENSTIDKQLSAADLSAMIQRIRGKKRAGGKKHLAPKSPTAGLGQINKLANDLLAKADVWDESVLNHFEKAGADQIGDDDFTAVADTCTNLGRAAERIMQLQQHSQKVLETMLRRKQASTTGKAAMNGNGKAHTNGAAKSAVPKIRRRTDLAAELGGKPRKKKAKKKLQRA